MSTNTMRDLRLAVGALIVAVALGFGFGFVVALRSARGVYENAREAHSLADSVLTECRDGLHMADSMAALIRRWNVHAERLKAASVP